MGGPPALAQLLLLSSIMGVGALLANLGRPDAQEISFQHFKTHLLGAGVVDRVEVTNKTSAKVFVRPSTAPASGPLASPLVQMVLRSNGASQVHMLLDAIA